jgi:putative transposase
VSWYARGRSPRDSQGHRAELSGTAGSPTLMSTSTDAVLDEGRTWQSRPLASGYPILYFAALCVQSRQEGPVQPTAVDLALGITMDGEKARLGLGRSESAGAQCWLAVFPERKNRGVQDGFMACVDGLKGLPEALEAVCPPTQGPLCLVHKVRHSLRSVPWRARRAVAAAWRAISGATTRADAAQALERFAERWDTKSPASSPRWRADGDRWTVLCDSPPALRRAISTTKAIASLNYS